MNSKAKTFLKVAGLTATVALPGLVMAGTGGADFDDVWVLITEWSQGSLGRVIAGTIILVGVVAGIANQSLGAFAIGLGGGVGLFYAPTIIDSVMTAALPVL